VEGKFKELREYFDRKLKELVGKPIQEKEAKISKEGHKLKFVIDGMK